MARPTIYLKTIACYGHVFERLSGQDLIDYTLRIATSRPGYEKYCRHRHEIERKVTTWVRAVENYYWPLGTTPTRDTASPSSKVIQFNQQQSEDAQSRIKAAYDQLEQTGELPEQITARAKAIARVARVSQQTLYKHRSLWHPNYLQGVMHEEPSLSAVESEPNERTSESSEPLKNGKLHPIGEKMKSEAPCAGDVGSDFAFTSPARGGYGGMNPVFHRWQSPRRCSGWMRWPRDADGSCSGWGGVRLSWCSSLLRSSTVGGGLS